MSHERNGGGGGDYINSAMSVIKKDLPNLTKEEIERVCSFMSMIPDFPKLILQGYGIEEVIRLLIQSDLTLNSVVRNSSQICVKDERLYLRLGFDDMGTWIKEVVCALSMLLLSIVDAYLEFKSAKKAGEPPFLLPLKPAEIEYNYNFFRRCVASDECSDGTGSEHSSVTKGNELTKPSRVRRKY